MENGGRCKSGGLRHNLGRVLEDGHILHADNPNPTFFDISHVFRPADRIAYISGKLEKAASAGIISGAELAEHLGVSAPIGFDAPAGVSRQIAIQLDALEKLAAAEQAVIGQPRNWTQVALASSPAVQPSIDFSECEYVKLSHVLHALAAAGVVLPVRDFLNLTLKSASAELVRAVTAGLDGIFSKLATNPDIVATLETNAYVPDRTSPVKTQAWANKVAMTHSVRPSDVEKRAYTAALRDVRNVEFAWEKTAAPAAAVALAQHYALYKLAAFAAISEKTGTCWLTANHCVLQNYIT